MGNQKGITMVSLVITIIIMLIIASITIVSSIKAYNMMRYETFQAELEEVQSAVNELCETYSVEKSLNSDLTYSTFFENKFGNVPKLVSESISENGVQELVSSYSALSVNSQYTYYFNTEDIKTYLGLEVSLNSIIVDFSTRYVYSVEGCVNPSNDDVIYHTLSEMDGETNIYENKNSSVSATIGLIASDDNSNKLYVSRRYKAFKSNINI